MDYKQKLKIISFSFEKFLQYGRGLQEKDSDYEEDEKLWIDRIHNQVTNLNVPDDSTRSTPAYPAPRSIDKILEKF
jgi:hypothetical protein